MSETDLSPEQWLEREDQLGRDDRLARLKWIASIYPSLDYSFISGGLTTWYLFGEARYCFVYGQFMATIVLSLAFIEQSFAALFYEAGRDDLERAGIKALTNEALSSGLLTQEESAFLDELRQLRNPIIHFRQPGDEQHIELRAVRQALLGGEPINSPYDLLEQDAKRTIEITFHFLNRLCRPEAITLFASISKGTKE